MKYYRKNLVTMVICSVFLSLATSVSDAGEKPLHVAVTIGPQLEFVESVGKDRVQVKVLVPPGANPETFEPSPQLMKQMAQVSAYFKVGTKLEFEASLLDKLVRLLPQLRVVDCSKGIDLIVSSAEKGVSLAGGHPHSTGDPHIWNSLRNARVMVENIANALAELDPAHADEYRSNAAVYEQKLADLDQEIGRMFDGCAGRKFIVYHPAWAYFARDYGLLQLAVEEEGKEPSLGAIRVLVNLARAEGINVVFASPQFNPESARLIAREIKGKVEFLDPLAEKYLDNMRQVAAKIAAAVR